MNGRTQAAPKPAGWIAGAALLALSIGAAQAGTLDKMRSSGEIVLGYRAASPPFSSSDGKGASTGFSIDLCQRVVAEAQRAAGLDRLAVRYVAVTPEDRVQKLTSGEIDIECGSTTRTLGRQAQVDFTLLTFVTGTELLVKVGSRIDGMADLAKKKVAVLPGTTTERVVQDQLAQMRIGTETVAVKDHDDGLRALEDGRADAYASDEIILIGLDKGAKDPAQFRLTGTLYSYEPYALMVRRDDADFRLAADRALAGIYRSGEIGGMYERWFGKWRNKPNPILVTLYRIQSLPE